MKLIKTKHLCLMIFVISSLLSNCSKDKYYFDGGTVDPKFNGTVLEYLKSRPVEFDTLVSIIKLAGLEENFNKDTMTFFAPTDYSIGASIRNTNTYLYSAGMDTIISLDQIAPGIWKQYLEKYMFHGKNLLNDYYHLDLSLENAFPGQNYFSYNNSVYNIGVIYDDINGIKYGGYRHILLSYIPDLKHPQDNWISANISSCNIQPINGVVHALDNATTFGFTGFANDVMASL